MPPFWRRAAIFFLVLLSLLDREGGLEYASEWWGLAAEVQSIAPMQGQIERGPQSPTPSGVVSGRAFRALEITTILILSSCPVPQQSSSSSYNAQDIVRAFAPSTTCTSSRPGCGWLVSLWFCSFPDDKNPGRGSTPSSGCQWSASEGRPRAKPVRRRSMYDLEVKNSH